MAPSLSLGLLTRNSGAEAVRKLLLPVDEIFETEAAALDYSPEAVVVAGPAATRVRDATPFVTQGIALLLEKPLANDSASGRRLLEMAESSRTPVMIGYPLRWHPTLAALREMLLTDLTGPVLFVRVEVGSNLRRWRPHLDDPARSVSARADLGGGALLELSHELDYLQWLFGPASSVMAMTRRVGDIAVDVEDIAELVLAIPGGLASVHLDMVASPDVRRCTVLGSRGTLSCDLLRNQIVACLDDKPPVSTKPIESASMFQDMLRHFLKVAEGTQSPQPDGRSGLNVVQLVEAAKRSASEGRVVELDIPTAGRPHSSRGLPDAVDR